MNGPATVSDKLGLGPEVRELKFGDSFANGRGTGFHTVRYDFKPASVDSSKMATLDVQNGQVTISVPNSDGAGVSVFTGPTKPYAKECVLIIDPESGECVLEKLTGSISVKKTRKEGISRIAKHHLVPNPPSGPPPPPSSLSVDTKRNPTRPTPPPAPIPSSVETKPASLDKLSNTSGKSSSMQRRPQSPILPRSSPLNNPSPSNRSPPANAFDTLLSNHKQQQQQQQQLLQASTMPSLTNFDDLLLAGPASQPTPISTSPPPPPPPHHRSSTNTNNTVRPHKNSTSSSSTSSSHPTPKSSTTSTSSITALEAAKVEAALSDSSSSSSSSGSSSESEASDDESSDDDDDEDMEVVPERNPPSSMPSMPTDLFSGNGLLLPQQPPLRPVIPPPLPLTSNLLSEDLQLSESGSDSD